MTWTMTATSVCLRMTTNKKCETVFKILVVLGLFSMSGYYILEAMDDWEASPTITLTSWSPLKGMKFPALTVCPVQDSRLTPFYVIPD